MGGGEGLGLLGFKVLGKVFRSGAPLLCAASYGVVECPGPRACDDTLSSRRRLTPLGSLAAAWLQSNCCQVIQ